MPSVAIPAHNLRGSCGVFRLNLCDVLRNIPKQINAVGGYAKNNFVLFHFFNPFCRRSARLLAFPFRSLASSASDFYRRTEKQKRLSSARSELLPVLASLLVLTRFCAYSVFNVRGSCRLRASFARLLLSDHAIIISEGGANVNKNRIGILHKVKTPFLCNLTMPGALGCARSACMPLSRV